jgi:hypothetical protein
MDFDFDEEDLDVDDEEEGAMRFFAGADAVICFGLAVLADGGASMPAGRGASTGFVVVALPVAEDADGFIHAQQSHEFGFI